MYRYLCLLLLLLLPVCGPVRAEPPSADTSWPLTRQSVLQPAGVQEAQELLRRRDGFIRALSRFDLQSRLKTDEPATTEDLLKLAAEQVRPWDAEELETLRAVVRSIHDQFAPFALPLPPVVLLIKTTGQEEGGAAYCRGNAIVLPERRLRQDAAGLERLLIHELFHILSRHNPPLRERLYGLIGFRACPPIELPQELRDRKITNPDGPTLEHYIELDQDGQRIKAVPILYANVPRYEARLGGPFFRFLEFRLLAVEVQEGQWKPRLVDGEPQLWEPTRNPSFLRQVGQNTNYLLHPDEILADNFVHLVKRTESLKTPEIVERMREVLTPNP